MHTGDVKPTPNHRVKHHIHTSSHPCFCKIPPPLSRKIANRQSRVQKVGICWHCLQVKITMSFSFAHGTLKRWIVAALWQLSPFKFGDNAGQVSFTKRARPFQRSTWLHNFFKNLSCQGLSPNSCRSRGNPKNCNYNTIWFVWIFVLPFWAVQCCTNISKNDGSHHRWSRRCVCIHERLTSQFFGEANTPLPSGGFFHSFSRQWPRHKFEKCVFATPSLEILGHRISATGAAPTVAQAPEIENCPQDIRQLQCFLGMVNFYRHFLPNCAQVLKPLTDLLKGGAKMLEWTASA